MFVREALVLRQTFKISLVTSEAFGVTRQALTLVSFVERGGGNLYFSFGAGFSEPLTPGKL